VWSLTWKDLEPSAPVTTLLTRVQRELYHQLFARERSALWTRDDALRARSSFDLLWEYLEHPSEEVWSAMGRRFAASMLETKTPWTAESIRAEEETLRSVPRREPSRLEQANKADGAPQRWAGLDARQHAVLLFQIATPLLQKQALEQGQLTLRLYDDHAARREPEFEESWRAFLHAWNVLQFHGDNLEVVSSELLQQWLEPGSEVASVPPKTRPPSARAPKDASDPYERFELEFSDGKHIAELAQRLRLEQLPLPVEASELSVSVELEGLLAWPNQRVVLIQDATAADVARWKAAGWLGIDYDAPAETILQALRGTTPAP
jgi:hypothetical protein